MNSSGSDIFVFDEIELEGADPEIYEPRYSDDAPSFPLGKLIGAREKLFGKIRFHEWGGDTVTISTCGEISRKMASSLGIPGRRDVIYESLYPQFMQQPIDHRLLYHACARITGNIDVIRKGMVIPTWGETSSNVWAPLEVVDVTMLDRAYMMKAFVGAEIPAGMFIYQKVSAKFLQYVLRQIGYPRFGRFASYEIFGTHFTCLLKKMRTATKMWAFSACSSQMENNRNLYKMRHGKCPLKLTVECGDCLRGASECPASIHRPSYRRGLCSRGHEGILSEGLETCNLCLYKDTQDRKFRYGRKEKYGKEKDGIPVEAGKLPEGEAEGRQEPGVLRPVGGHNPWDEVSNKIIAAPV